MLVIIYSKLLILAVRQKDTKSYRPPLVRNKLLIRTLAHAHPTAKICKCVAWKGFCERVCELIVRRDMLVLENTTGADVAEKLDLYLVMFCSCAQLRGFCHRDSSLVVLE